MTRSLAFLLACAATWLSSCSPTRDDSPSVQPGDHLVDVAIVTDVVAFPQSNVNARVARRLDEAVSAANDDFALAKALVATPTVDNWRPGRSFADFDIPAGLEQYIPNGESYRAFSATPEMRPTAPPTILIDDVPQKPWLQTERFPDAFVFWDKQTRTLRAIARGRPQRVRVRAEIALVDEFGRWELTRSLMGQTPEMNELRRRTTVGDESLAVLFAPAPARLSFSIPRLEANSLGVSVAIVNRGWSAPENTAGKTIHRLKTSGCKGARFAVDVVRANGEVERAWTHVMGSTDVGKAFIDARVDLTPWRGEEISLQLVTEGVGSTPTTHAYCVWGGLRFEDDSPPTPDQPHVVLIDIDTLRADRLGTYGCERPTSPNIDAWTNDRAVVYEHARSTGPFTLPATASMLTGLDTHQHGVDDEADQLASSAGSIATTLRAAGYETVAITEGGYVSSDFGFDHGFDRFTLLPTHKPKWDSALDRIDRGAPVFLFLQTFMVHSPFEYDPTFLSGYGGRHDAGGPSYRGHLATQGISHDIFVDFRQDNVKLDSADRRYVADLYDAGVLRMDNFIAAILERLESVDGDVLVILTSDHGEELFERDMLGHGQTLYNELLHVPLIVSFPDGRTGRDARTASLVDIVPTILDIVGLDQPPHLPGHSLAATAPGDRSVVSRIDGDIHAIETSSGAKLVDGPIDTPRGVFPAPQLFDVGADPRERNDLATREPERVNALTRVLTEYLETWHVFDAARSEGGSDAATQERLRALGYLDAEPDGDR